MGACDPRTANRLGGAVRRGIEREVARGEKPIAPPSPVSELSCLGNLMQAPQLDLMFPTQSQLTNSFASFLVGAIQGTIDRNAGREGFDPSAILPGTLCRFAQDRWNAQVPALTGPLRGFGAAIAGAPQRGQRPVSAQRTQMRRILGIEQQ